MFKKICLLTLIIAVLLSASIANAAPIPPEKGQWALALESSLRLYEKADFDSDYSEVDMPDKWLSVPSAVRDDDNYLWYKVKVNDQSGWLPQNGVMLKMGGKSKIASNIYKNFVKARKKVMARPRNWNTEEYDGMTSYRTEGAEFRVIKSKKGIEDVFFEFEDADLCKEFLGVDIIGLYQPQLRKKLGTPTFRESPYEDKDINILSFELADKNMTLTITERRENGSEEGKVIYVSLYRGRAGEPF